MVPRPGAAWLAACLPGNPRVIRGFRPVFSIRQHAPNGLEATIEIQPRVPDTPTNARHRVQDTLGSTRTHRGSGTRSMCQVRRDGRDPDILTVTSTRARHSDTASRTKETWCHESWRAPEWVSAGGFCPSTIHNPLGLMNSAPPARIGRPGARCRFAPLRNLVRTAAKQTPREPRFFLLNILGRVIKHQPSSRLLPDGDPPHRCSCRR